MSKSRYVITVTRQFGNMGRLLAKKLANKINQQFPGTIAEVASRMPYGGYLTAVKRVKA